MPYDILTVEGEEIQSVLEVGSPGIPGAQGPPGLPGSPGAPGQVGPAGPGVAPGGTAGQVLEKNSTTDFDTIWATPAAGGVTSFNTRLGPITLTTDDITGALGYVPEIEQGIYNIRKYGALINGVTDDTAAINAALAAAANASGGIVYFPPGTCLVLGQLTIPTDGSPTPRQHNLKMMGSAGHVSGQGGAAYGGSILDMRYAVGRTFTDGVTTIGSATLTSATAAFTAADVGKGISGAGIPVRTTILSVQSATSLTMSANATATATGVAVIVVAPKFDTRGLGLLEITGLTFMEGGTATTPFLSTTNTTLHIHDCAFIGFGAGTGCQQDAIILGGLSTIMDGGFDAPFQGYGTVIEANYFNHIRRGIWGRTYCNGCVFCDNTWWSNCGSTANEAAIDIIGLPSNTCSGNVIRGNLIEVSSYTYAIKLDYAIGTTIIGNNYYDPTATVSAYIRLGVNANYNFIIHGFHSDGYPAVSDLSNNSNTVLTYHQGQRTLWTQPWTFTQQSITTGGLSPIVQSTTGDTFYEADSYSNTTGISTQGFRFNASSRSITDGVITSGSNVLTSATAAFLGGDVGKTLVGTGIPGGATISSVTNATTVVMSANATATATGVSVAINGNIETVVTFSRVSPTDKRISFGGTTNSRLESTTSQMQIYCQTGQALFLGDPSKNVFLLSGAYHGKGAGFGTQTLVYGTSIACDPAVAVYGILSVTNTTAFAIAAPSTAFAGQLLTYEITNNSGGVMGAVTWNVAFRLAGVWVSPAAGMTRTISFIYNGTKWVETSRAAADIP
jgi:Pectate lyase superfamily protein